MSSFQGNVVGDEDDTVQKISELLTSRDPLVRSRTQSESLPSPIEPAGRM